MRIQRTFAIVFSALLVTLAVTTVSTAQAPPVTLAVTPDAVTLAPGETAHAIVTAKLSITTTEAITLTAFTDVGVEVAIENPARTSAGLQGDLVWAVTVTRSMAGRTTGKVHLRADYQWRDSNDRLVPGVVTATLDVQERPADTIDKVMTAEFQTSSDTWQDQQSRNVFIVVKNISSVPITVTHITPQPIANVSIEVQPVGSGVRLEPQQSNPFSLTLGAGTVIQPVKLYLVVRLDTQWEKSGQTTNGSLVLSKEISQDRPTDTIDKMVTAEYQTSSDTLQDQQFRYVYIVVKNISSIPITITHITPEPMANVLIEVQSLSSGVRLEPLQSNPFSMTLYAGTAVQSGKHYLVTRIDAQWEKSGQTTNGSLVLNKEFTIGVFGESTILTATAIPSVFFLPGFLYMLTLNLLFKLSWKKTLTDIDFKKPEFWYWAITISLAAMLLYTQVTRPFLQLVFRQDVSSNLLQGYGFNDIALLWLGFVILGIGTWAVGSAFYVGYRRFQAWRERQRRAALIPGPKDNPMQILKKIAKNQSGFDLEKRTYAPASGTQQDVYVLPSGLPEAGKVWVAPHIIVHLLKPQTAVLNEYDRLVKKPEEPYSLIDQLTKWAKKPKTVELSWDLRGSVVQQVTQVDDAKTTLVARKSDDFLVRQK